MMWLMYCFDWSVLTDKDIKRDCTAAVVDDAMLIRWMNDDGFDLHYFEYISLDKDVRAILQKK